MLKAVERASLRLNQVDRASLRRESMGRTILRGNLNRASFRKGRRHIVQFLEIFVIVHGFTRIYIFFLHLQVGSPCMEINLAPRRCTYVGNYKLHLKYNCTLCNKRRK